jgi:hypothetical protein
MASEEVHWASAPGLRSAAIRVEAEGRRFATLVSDLYAKVGSSIVDPRTFGTDKGGGEFFAKWDSFVRDWDEGVRTVSTSILATSRGVNNMAQAVEATDRDTTRMAEDLNHYVAGGGGGGGNGGSPNAPHIPPLAPPNPGGNGGGGGSTGGNGRH